MPDYIKQQQARDAKRIYKMTVDAATGFGRGIASHSDDAKGMFAAELVKETVKQLMERRYPEFRWAQGKLVPFNRGGHPGAKTREWYEKDVVGEADFISDMGDDAPTVGMNIAPHVNRYAKFGIKMVVTDDDVDRANLQGLFSVATELSSAAKRGYMQKLNSLVLNGDANRGITGIRSAPGALRFQATNGSWDTASPSSVSQDISAAIDAIFNGSETVYKPDTIVLPSELAGRLHEIQNSVASDLVLMERMRKVFGPGTEFPIKNWIFDHTMNTAGDTGGRAFLMYTAGNEWFEGLLPVDFKPARAKQEPMYMEQTWFGKYGGLALYHPRSIAFVQGI